MREKSVFVLWFKELGKEDIPLVGGKCANLGELFGKIGVPVPNGFAVSAYAYKFFLEKTKADKQIESLLLKMNLSDMESLQDVLGENQETYRKSSNAERYGEGDPSEI